MDTSNKAILIIFGMLLFANFIVCNILLINFNNTANDLKSESKIISQQIQELKDQQAQAAQLLKATQVIVNSKNMQDAAQIYDSNPIVPLIKTPYQGAHQ